MSRERDVRVAIKEFLESTNAFTSVYITGLPEDYGQGASDIMAAAIQPDAGSMRDLWDATDGIGLEVSGQTVVTLLSRNPDPEARDEAAEQLLDHLMNAVNGRSLGGLTMPDGTMVKSWKYLPEQPPERRVRAVVQYRYVLTGWGSFDVTN